MGYCKRGVISEFPSKEITCDLPTDVIRNAGGLHGLICKHGQGMSGIGARGLL